MKGEKKLDLLDLNTRVNLTAVLLVIAFLLLYIAVQLTTSS